MNDRPRASWLVYTLGALCIVAIVAAFLVVGPSSQSATTQSRTVTVAEGVVQSTVSGSGNLQAASQLNLGFKTSGVVDHIYVTQGEHVSSGQLVATLNPQTAEVALEQSKATLEAAEASLAQEEETGGETASGASGAKASAAAFMGGPTGSTGSTGLSGAQTTPAGAPAVTTATTTSAAVITRSAETTQTRTTAAPRATTTERSTTAEKTKQSAATRDANLASARAAVKSDKLAVQSAEESVSDTKLYAPSSGTIVSLSGEVGETVSGGGTSKASTGSSSSTGTGSSTTAGAGAATSTRAATASSSSSTGSGSSTSSAFAVLSDLSAMQLVVPLSESEIQSVSVGQPATITIEALEGKKVAAEVVNVATLSTSNSGVVSYDVTFQLNQLTGGLKPGMSASAEVVVKQAEGVNVPTTAISGGSVTVVEGEKHVRRAVVTGLAGNSSTIILSGLKAGEKIALPIASSSSATSLTSKLGGRGSGGLGGAGGFGGGLGGGGGAFRVGG